MKWLCVTLLGLLVSTTVVASPRPRVMEPDHVFAAFRAVTVLPLRDAQSISFDSQRRMVTLKSKMPKKRRQDLLDRAAASPHVGHIELIGQDQIVLWLRSMRTEVVLIEPGGAVREPKIVLGERRKMLAPRAMYLSGQCVLSYTEVDDARLEQLVMNYCTGMWGLDDTEEVDGLVGATRGQLARTLKLLSLDAKVPTRLSSLERLASRHKGDPQYVTQVWLSIVLHLVSRDELETALQWLDKIAKHQKRTGVRWSPERQKMIKLLAQGLFERLVQGNLLTGDLERAIEMYTTYRHWEGKGLIRVRRKVIQSHRMLGKSLEAASLYTELAQDKRLRGSQRRSVYGELSTTYLEAADPFRAWHTYRYIRERWGKNGLEPDYDLYVTWFSQNKTCMKSRDAARCEAIAKPDPTKALDLTRSKPVPEPAYSWHKTSLPIAL